MPDSQQAEAAKRRWIDRDPVKGTLPARTAFHQKFFDQVDPNRELPEHERAKLARQALSDHMRKIRANRADLKAAS